MRTLLPILALSCAAALGSCSTVETAPRSTASSSGGAGASAGTGGGVTGTGAMGGGGAGGSEVCRLNDCYGPEDCAGCADGRNQCLLSENRCVACNPVLPPGEQGCPPGEECTPYGICVPAGLTCPTDPHTGEPTVVCTQDEDCQGCPPMRQVCDPSHHCVACTETNTEHCLPTQSCVDGECTDE